MFWALAILKACPADIWRLLLDKLSKVPTSSFDDADQHQLYQVYLLLDTAGTVLPSACHQSQLVLHIATFCPAYAHHVSTCV